MIPDYRALADLAAFAMVEVDSGDIEPWAACLAFLHDTGVVDTEQAAWLVALYNTYDAFSSAFGVFSRWDSPNAWLLAEDNQDAALFECTQERRGLRGGKVLLRHSSYTAELAGQPQLAWLQRGLVNEDPSANLEPLTTHLRTVWGVGRQSAFEWAEFASKVLALPVEAADAQLWESEGPRRSLQRLYRRQHDVSPAWLNDAANHCKQFLARCGVDLTWWDWETVICDFNVMRDGRYYPGRHLAAIREEIASMPQPWRSHLETAWHALIPEPWSSIKPGIDKIKWSHYRRTGEIVKQP